jgi:hypothetical protein
MAAQPRLFTQRIVRCFTKLPDAPADCRINLNCLNFFPTNIYHHPLVGAIDLSQISPYVLADTAGHLMENIWQGSKVYPRVDAQNEVKAGKQIWLHPSETHLIDGTLTPAFWEWRKKLWENPYPVRYPNGYKGKAKAVCSLWFEGGEWRTYDYLTARKVIYCRVYAALVQQTEAFQKLKALYDGGHSIQICEIDVRPGEVTRETLERELVNPAKSFGHGYVLSACIMGLTSIFD